MSIFLQDDFSGTGTLAGHSPSGTGAVGGVWVDHPASTYATQLSGSGSLKTAAASLGIAYNPADPGADNYSAEIAFATNEGICGVRVRHNTSANTCYEAIYYLSPQEVRLYRWDAGSGVLLWSAAGHPTCASLKLEVSGTGATVNCKVYKNGSGTPLNGAGGTDDSSANRIVARGRVAVRTYDVVNTTAGITSVTTENGAAGDTTAPNLSSPTGTATGSSTASGTVTTDEANGTLYAVATISATAPSVTQIQAGQDNTGAAAAYATNQTVSAVGVQNVGATGLAPSTTYRWHYQQRDAAGNNSTVVTSAAWTTNAPPDTTAPTMSGSITISALTSTSYTATWPAGSDNVAVTGYEYRIGTGTWTSVGNVLTTNISGRTPGVTESFQVRAFDAAGNRSSALSVDVTLLTPTIITDPFRNVATGVLMASATIPKVWVICRNDDTMDVLVDQVTDGAGQLTIDTGLITDYVYAVVAAGAVAVDPADTEGAIRHYVAVEI